MEGSHRRVVAMNFSGRFSGREIRAYAQEVLQQLLLEHQVAMLFGQQMNFKSRPAEGYEQVGGNKAFLLYNKSRFRAGQERQFRQVIRDLQYMGKLPQHYLPDTNYAVCKFKSRDRSGKEFIAMSVVTDECYGKAKSLSMFKKIIAFAVNLSILEEQPVLMAGTFRIDANIVRKCLPQGFTCYDYTTKNPRRLLRMADLFVTSSEFQLTHVAPLLTSELDLPQRRGSGTLRNPEDAFYFDPITAGARISGVDSLARPLGFVQPQPAWGRRELQQQRRRRERDGYSSSSSSGEEREGHFHDDSSCDSCAPRSRFPRGEARVTSHSARSAPAAARRFGFNPNSPSRGRYAGMQAEQEPEMSMEELLTRYMSYQQGAPRPCSAEHVRSRGSRQRDATGQDDARISPTAEQTSFSETVETYKVTSDGSIINDNQKLEVGMARVMVDNGNNHNNSHPGNNHAKPDLLRFEQENDKNKINAEHKIIPEVTKNGSESDMEKSTVAILKKVQDGEQSGPHESVTSDDTDSIAIAINIYDTGSSSPDATAAEDKPNKVYQQVPRDPSNNQSKKWKSEMKLDAKRETQPSSISMEVIKPAGSDVNLVEEPGQSMNQFSSVDNLQTPPAEGLLETQTYGAGQRCDSITEEDSSPAASYAHLYPAKEDIARNSTCYMS